MISLKSKIDNSLLLEDNTPSKDKYFCDVLFKALNDTKLTKEQITTMLNNIDSIKLLKIMSDYLYDIDGKNYLVYQPSNDMFLNDSNINIIIDRLSEYLFKFVTNK